MTEIKPAVSHAGAPHGDVRRGLYAAGAYVLQPPARADAGDRGSRSVPASRSAGSSRGS